MNKWITYGMIRSIKIIATNKAMIAEAFNTFFVNIGPKLADKIDIK